MTYLSHQEAFLSQTSLPCRTGICGTKDPRHEGRLSLENLNRALTSSAGLSCVPRTSAATPERSSAIALDWRDAML